jgi:hypothetical protein
MEQILWLYALEYDPKYPVLCFDERPCFLIGNTKTPIAMRSGKVTREHYAYEKNGSCALLAAIEPLTGKRIAKVYDRRTKKEYADFMNYLAQEYPNADKIRIVQDNLNTHSTSSFYQHFSAQKAFDLAQKMEFYFTPKSASWLNMIEIEFSALARQCLNARIPNKDLLEKKVLTLVKERNDKKIKINWQFSIDKARYKLKRHYLNVNPEML